MPRISKRDNFENILLARGVLTEEQLQSSLGSTSGLPLEKYLAQNPAIDQAKLTLAMADYFQVRPVTLPETLVLPRELLELATLKLWKKLKAAPLMKLDKVITVAFGDPFDLLAQEDMAQRLKLKIIPVVARETEVMAALSRSEKKSDKDMGIEMESIMRSPETEVEISNLDVDKDDSLDQRLETADEAP